jgi:cytochrome c6
VKGECATGLRRGRHAAGFCFLLSCIATVAAAATAANVERGARIYGEYCSNCHGDELRNTTGGVTFDLRRLRTDDHDRFVNSVLNGKQPMPSWRGVLNQEQIEAIWAYIRATVDR